MRIRLLHKSIRCFISLFLILGLLFLLCTPWTNPASASPNSKRSEPGFPLQPVGAPPQSMRELPVGLGRRGFAEENRDLISRVLNGTGTTGRVFGSPNTGVNAFQNPATASPSPLVTQAGLTPPPPSEMLVGANRAAEFNGTLLPVTTGPPGPNLPNLDQLRTTKPAEESPAKTFGSKPPADEGGIRPMLPCADCEGGGGGGGYYPPNDPRFSTARTLPPNQTGEQGVDLGSRNFNWGVTLLSLPGRAGLDLNLTLFYNSLVWTRDGSYIKYNADLGTPAPGFRLGFPTVQQRFFNSQTGIWAYMMVTAAGGRVELRQVTTNVYESADSSYTQLIDNGSSLLVRTSDGTQLTFLPTSDVTTLGYRCTEVKDRNGNYLSATYDPNTGRTLSMTDTLGRVINFNYPSGNLDSITQLWNGVPHEWARFEYQQQLVAPSFGGGLLVNGPNNQSVTVLTKVILQNLDSYSFAYNIAFGQVNRINHNAPDDTVANPHVLAYTSYNVNSASAQTECPRFTEQRNWAQFWNGDWDGVPATNEEAVTSYAVAGDNSWTKVTFPDGTVYKEYYLTSGWPTGLTITTKNYANTAEADADTPRKWTTINWDQDDINLTYQKNPRPIETNVCDSAGNQKRTTIEYTSGYALPTYVREWGGVNAGQLLRLTVTTYRTDSCYLDRRMIALPFERLVYDGPTGNLQARSVFHYDWGDPYLAGTAPATNFDSGNYPASFTAGRGNLVGVRRYDCTNTSTAYNDSLATWVQLIGYNVAGAVAWTEDGRFQDGPAHHQTISYADSFSDGNNGRGTQAYPTTMTDADGKQFLTKYNFDFGAMTWQQSPSPNAGQTAPTVSYTYDAAGRRQQVTNDVNGAYTRRVYSADGMCYLSYTTVEAGAGEAYSATCTDGAGRNRAAIADLPNSTGGYSASWVVYDVMGRVVQSFNPTEVNASWIPTGDDAGWVGTIQAYDWKGRPTLTTNPDGSTRENTYGGCGCAGGEVVTSRDEAGRRTRATMDVLGRLWKVEELKFGQSVYSSTTYTYNARDQIETINNAGQVRTFEYDGYGRLWHKTTPEQGTSTYTYWPDDTLKTMTDARSAKVTYDYNGRHQVTSITYDLSQASGVAPTTNVTYQYDAAGNRTGMWDGTGSHGYQYDQLSRLTMECRYFNDLGTSYCLSYGYNLAGQLTSITNPWNAVVGYGHDKTGRVTSVSGANYAGVSSYINNISYRAFGAAKQISYGNGRTLSLQYNNRLFLTQWNVPGVLGYAYHYDNYGENNTGRVTFADNLTSGAARDPNLDRSWYYEDLGRLTVAYTGPDARATIGTDNWGPGGPYGQGYWYDVFGNTTQRQGWGGWNASDSASYVNNRRNGLQYDPSGNLTGDGYSTFTYDANSQTASSQYSGIPSINMQMAYDGDGLRGKKVENGDATYYLRSSVLGGQVICEIKNWGYGWSWWRGYVYLGGQLLAIQHYGVTWVHQEPMSKGQRLTDVNGSITATIELDPWGSRTDFSSANDAFQPHRFTSYERDLSNWDDAQARRYHGFWSRFSTPDPYDGSYDFANPQSFNRYSYVNNDPVNFVDPSGLCTFNIGVANNNLLNHNQLQALKSEISRIFGTAGQQINFVSRNADYFLNINAHGAGYSNNSRDVGITYLSGSSVTSTGRVFVDRLTASATRDSASATAFGQNSNALAIGLGRAGSHEIAHYLLQQNFDSPMIRGVMHDGFSGAQWFSNATQGLWTFSAAQIMEMNKLCAPISTPTQVPNNSPTLRPPISGRAGGGGRDIRPIFGGGGFGGGGFGGWTSLDLLYLGFGSRGGGSVSVSFNGQLKVL